jgi:DNA gyrase subunit A
MLQAFIDHRIDVIVRRTQYDLNEAEKRAHILEGLRIAIDNIDEIIELIKSSKNPEKAKIKLIERFSLSEIQAKAILEMRLQRLTGLERDKIEKEYREVIALIEKLKAILASRDLQFNIIKEELDEIMRKYADSRRTVIDTAFEDLTFEDLIAEEDMVVTISHGGAIKRLPVSHYRTQNRGGRGSTGAKTKDEDFIEHVFVAGTHDYILFFTDHGKCYWLKVYSIPPASKISKGRPIINLIDISKGEKIKAFITVENFEKGGYVVMATEQGVVKRTSLSAFSRPRRNGIFAVNIRENDHLLAAKLSDGKSNIVITTKKGKAIRFEETQVREMGRSAAGVRGIRLKDDDKAIAMVVVKADQELLTISEKGYGKRTSVENFRAQTRGGSGIIAMKTTEKTGDLVSTLEVSGEEDLMIITEKGVVIRQSVGDISVIGRNTQGVKLIRLDDNDKVSAVAHAPAYNEEEESEEE